MPDLLIKNTLRLGTLALAVVSLMACGGGDVGDDDLAQANEAIGSDNAGRATALAVSSQSAGGIQLVTTTTSGASASTSSTTCALSANGRLVLFASDAANFVAGDTNGRTDLFLKNLDTSAVQRVTTQSNGAQIATGGSCSSMTPDGRFVAFNSGGAVFVKNTQTGQLTQASPAAGTVPQVVGYFGGSLSHDGRHIAFVTQPQQVYVGRYDYANVVPARLMLRDLETGGLQTPTTDNGIVAQGQVIGLGAALSPDGTRVAFVSSSSSLVPGDNNGRPDVFVRDLVSGGTSLASSSTEGLASTAVQYTNIGLVSNTQVVFRISGLSSLGASGLYLKHLDSGVLSLLMGTAEGDASGLSADLRKLIFTRIYSGFDRRVFVRDLSTGQDALVSASASGTPSNYNATGAIISLDGSTVIFGSNARNLVSPRPPAGVFQAYAKAIGAASAQ
jgi:Tol biopolymer transport system component